MNRKLKRSPNHRKTATVDIVDNAVAANRVRPAWRTHYERLLKLRDDLLHQKRNLARDAAEESPNFSMHMADAATDSFDRDLALSLLSSEQDALYEVEQALSRIRSGNYGICELTGKRIQSQRLDAIPWTRFST